MWRGAVPAWAASLILARYLRPIVLLLQIAESGQMWSPRPERLEAAASPLLPPPTSTWLRSRQGGTVGTEGPGERARGREGGTGQRLQAPRACNLRSAAECQDTDNWVSPSGLLAQYEGIVQQRLLQCLETYSYKPVQMNICYV